MSPNEQKITSGRDGDGVGPVDHLQRRHADRAAGAVHQLDARRQDVVDAVLDDRVRLAAADFHDGPGPRDGAGDGRGQLPGGLGIAIFVEVFHDDGSSSSSSWFILPRNSKTRCASASSMRDRAKPTWTST